MLGLFNRGRIMFDEYELIRIINLPHRSDRRRQMTAELSRVGVVVDNERVAFFNAIATAEPDGFYSAGARMRPNGTPTGLTKHN